MNSSLSPLFHSKLQGRDMKYFFYSYPFFVTKILIPDPKFFIDFDPMSDLAKTFDP